MEWVDALRVALGHAHRADHPEVERRDPGPRPSRRKASGSSISTTVRATTAGAYPEGPRSALPRLRWRIPGAG